MQPLSSQYSTFALTHDLSATGLVQIRPASQTYSRIAPTSTTTTSTRLTEAQSTDIMSSPNTIQCTRSHCVHQAVDNAALQAHLSQPYEENYRYICHVQGFGCEQVLCTVESANDHITHCSKFIAWNKVRKYGKSMASKRLHDMFKQSIAQVTGEAPAGPPPGFSHQKAKKPKPTSTKEQRTSSDKKTSLGKHGRSKKRSLEEDDEAENGSDDEEEYVDTPRPKRIKTTKSDKDDQSNTKTKPTSTKPRRQAEKKTFSVTSQQGDGKSSTEDGEVPAEQETEVTFPEIDPFDIEYRNDEFIVGPQWVYDHDDQPFGVGTEITGTDGKVVPGLTLAAIENGGMGSVDQGVDQGLAEKLYHLISQGTDWMSMTQEEIDFDTDGNKQGVEGMLDEQYRELAFETGWIAEIEF